MGSPGTRRTCVIKGRRGRIDNPQARQGAAAGAVTRDAGNAGKARALRHGFRRGGVFRAQGGDSAERDPAASLRLFT